MEFLRRRLGLILRTLVSVALIAYLLHNPKIHWAEVWNKMLAMDPRWLVAGFGAFLPVVLIVSWRWRLLLGVHGVHLPFRRVFELTMIGQYFSAFLIGTTGGDFVKIFYVARAVPSRKAAVAFTVMVDRVIGLVALLLLGAALALPQLHLLLSQPWPRSLTGVFFLLVLGGVVAGVGATVAPLFLKRPTIRNFLKRLPFARRGASLFAAYETTAQAWKTNLLALVVSWPSHLCGITMGYCILMAMHLQHEPGIFLFCAILVMVNTLISLPISISGVGFREQLFIWFLALVSVGPNEAFTFSITFFFLNMLWSLAGAPFYFLYRHETHTPAPVTAEVEPLFSRR